MIALLGLVAPILEKLAFVMVKVAVSFLTTPWPALYMLFPLDFYTDLPLQIIFAMTISHSIFCYTLSGTKMLKLSSQFDLLLLKQLTICQLYPHCLSLNHEAYHFTLTLGALSLFLHLSGFELTSQLRTTPFYAFWTTATLFLFMRVFLSTVKAMMRDNLLGKKS